MNTRSQAATNNGNAELKSRVRKRIIQVVIQFLIFALILFLTSGKLNWIWAWAYMGVSVLILAINAMVLAPELMAERGEVKENVESWDRFVALIGSIFTLVTIILPGLDLRFEWSPPLNPFVQIIGVIGYALGMGLFTWSMASNPFFSGVVRIQMDRDQVVATGGPYRYVRHPGYVGYILSWIATALALGSLWALIPAGLILITMTIRTALEDRTLQEKLDGYSDYAKQVRYRLLPGIW
jgi:protein-S-isoprenylcysteine O-methyltransferase Ste14